MIPSTCQDCSWSPAGFSRLVFGFSHADTTAWRNSVIPSGSWLLQPFLLIDVCVCRDPGGIPAASASGPPQPNPGWLTVGVPVRQRRLLRCLPVPDVLPPGHVEIQSDQDWLGIPAPRRCGGRNGPGVESGPAARVGPKPIVPLGLLVSATALYGLHLIGQHSSYATAASSHI